MHLQFNDNFVNADHTYDTVFQTTNGFALILRVYLPANVNCTPLMTLHGIRATHTWLDKQMKVIGYPQIASDQRWKASNMKLGDAVYAVLECFQVNPQEFLTLHFLIVSESLSTDIFCYSFRLFCLSQSQNNGDHRYQFDKIAGKFNKSKQQAIVGVT
jgi:hypothetical protein